MKRNILKSVFILGLFFSMQSCITMQNATIAEVKPAKGTKVETTVGGLGFLMLAVPKHLVQDASDKIRQKGAVGNITTTLTVRHWGIVQYYSVLATGYTEAR